MAYSAIRQFAPAWTKIAFPLLLLIQLSLCQYYLEEKACAVLHEEENFLGQQFKLRDRDQSLILAEDHRAPDSSWNATGSITVESGCVLEVCNETYFDGTCKTIVQGTYPTKVSLNLSDISSTSCSCHKECKCSDIWMKKSSCGRAYLEGGCKTCHSQYTDLNRTAKFFPEEFEGRVKAFRLRKGCTLTLYEEEDWEGETEIIDREIYEDYSGEFHSYECECDDSQFVPRPKPDRPISYPPLIDIPETLDDVIKMLTTKEFANHPGLQASHMSLKHGRSSKNAYILLLGSTGAGKSSAINLLFDNPNVTKVGDRVSTTTDIHEFRIPVPIDEIGVGNSELRVIDTPGLGDTRGLQQDATFLATLDSYLSNHEELNDRIPNVVLVFHKFHDNRFDGPGSAFVKMLRGLDSFRERITGYSNVIFVLSHFCSETKANQKRPDVRLMQFKEVIENYSLLPRPTIITVAENKANDQELPMVNGYFRLPNNDYYPRNLFEKLELVTEKGGDMIGLGTTDWFKGAQESTTISRSSIMPTFQLIRQKFPSYSNIPGTREDVPQTTTGMLELLTAIKNDDATRELLKKAFKIQAPQFPHNTIAGYSYNVFKDAYLPTSPFTLGDVHGSDIGFLIPKTLTCKLEPSTKQNFYVFDTQEQYLRHRLHNLGIDGNITAASFEGAVKPGHNIKQVSFNNDSCSLSATREFRLFDFVLNDKLDLTPEFQNAVRSLPPYDGNDHENVEKWTKFFNDYGTHVVKSVHGGGAIEIKLESNKPYDEKLSQALFDLVKFAEEMSFMIVGGDDVEEGGAPDSNNNGTKIKTVIPAGITHSLTFLGGDSAFHTTDLTSMSLEKASKLLRNWKDSLKFNPTVLTTEMRLRPIGQIVKKLGQNYSSEIEKATSLLFKSDLKYVPPQKIKGGIPGESRQDTSFMNDFLKEQALSNQKIQELMLGLKQTEAQNEIRRQEMEERRLQWEQEQKKADQAFRQAQLEAQMKAEEAKQKMMMEMEQFKLKQEAERAKQQQEYQQALLAAQQNREQENERRRQEMEERRLKWEREQKEADQAFQKAQLEAQIKAEEEKQKRLAEAEQIRLANEAERVKLQMAFQQAQEQARQREEERRRQILVEIANRPPPRRSRCLKTGTKILMADMTERPVESLQVGDLVMDKDFNPTKVLGASYEFLLGHEYYGFDNESFFFTDGHLFVGPSENQEARLYAKSLTEVYRFNPLMEYLNVEEFGDDKETNLFHFNHSESHGKLASLSTKTVGVFTDPSSSSFPPDTPTYFLIVDSPTGTYFANGFVCRHDVPPLEIWPNTMGLLFRLTENSIFQQYAKIPFGTDTIAFIDGVVDEVSDAVQTYITSQNFQDHTAEQSSPQLQSGGESFSVMTLADVDVETSISNTFDNPTVGSVGNGLYAKVGRLISPYLDWASYGRPDSIGNDLGRVQHEIFNIIINKLEKHLQLYIPS